MSTTQIPLERGESVKKITLKSISSIYFCLVSLLIFVLIFEIVPTNFVSAVITTTVNVFPSTVAVSVGQNVIIEVKITDVLDLYGWEFRLRWNPILLDAVAVIEGNFLDGGGARNTFFWSIVNNTAGYILADCTLLGDVPGVNGSGTLATVIFYVKYAGESVLSLDDTKLISSDEQSISHEATDGYGYFIFPHDVAVTDVNASPTLVLSGQLVNINVTVQNQGGYAENFTVTAYYDSTVIGNQPVSVDVGASAILTFGWDTAGVGKGDYTISAEASVVPDETDTIDNTNEADCTVTVLSPGHDVAITDVTPFKTIVGQGYHLFINVTTKNYGSFPEIFNVTTYCNETNFIEKQTITLSSGNSSTITFTWSTTGFAKGHYRISAYAEPVLDETAITDNTFLDGWVLVTIPGDVDGDRDVDVGDQRQVQLALFTMPERPVGTPTRT